MAQPDKNRSFYSKYFREGEVLHGLQVQPDDREWVLSVPKDDVKPHDVVLYLGCNVLKTSNLVQTVVDIFKLMDVDFVAVGGASYCCGIQHFQRGDESAARSMSHTTMDNFKKFQPEQVVMWCPSCIYFYDDIMDLKEEMPFQHVTEFLMQNLDKLDFKPQPEAKVSLHYHTGREQSDIEARSAFQLLSLLPGIEVADLGSDARLSRHCTAAAREKTGAEIWDGIIKGSFDRAVEENVDIYSTLYHGCQRDLCRHEKDYPLRVDHYLTLVGPALGIEHEDLYKKYMMMGDLEGILAETSPCSVASGIKPEEAREIIQKTFVN